MTKALQVSARNGRVIKGISMKSKIVLITGANTGIGYETVKDLAQRGARVIMACRDMKKCEDAKQKVCMCYVDMLLTSNKSFIVF